MNNPDMTKVVFQVQGSAPEPYTVEFTKEGTNLNGFCSCPAGIVGQYCKHRFRILSGDVEGVIGDRSDDVEKVASWLPGTDVEVALQKLAQAEVAMEAAKKEVSLMKKNVARSLRN